MTTLFFFFSFFTFFFFFFCWQVRRRRTENRPSSRRARPDGVWDELSRQYLLQTCAEHDELFRASAVPPPRHGAPLHRFVTSEKCTVHLSFFRCLARKANNSKSQRKTCKTTQQSWLFFIIIIRIAPESSDKSEPEMHPHLKSSGGLGGLRFQRPSLTG